jgi:phosphocarrier protein
VHVGSGEREVDAKSLLSILALGAEAGSTLSLRADGPDAAEALSALAATVAAFS